MPVTRLVLAQRHHAQESLQGKEESLQGKEGKTWQLCGQKTHPYVRNSPSQLCSPRGDSRGSRWETAPLLLLRPGGSLGGQRGPGSRVPATLLLVPEFPWVKPFQAWCGIGDVRRDKILAKFRDHYLTGEGMRLSWALLLQMENAHNSPPFRRNLLP